MEKAIWVISIRSVFEPDLILDLALPFGFIIS
jgi:hypothetical protein